MSESQSMFKAIVTYISRPNSVHMTLDARSLTQEPEPEASYYKLTGVKN